MSLKNTAFRFGALLAIAGFLVTGCSGASTSQSVAPVAQAQIPSAPHGLQPASPTDKRTIAAQGVVRADSNCNSRGGCYSYVLLVPLAIDEAGAFSQAPWYPACHPLYPWEAPWYLSLYSFSLPLSSTDISACGSELASRVRVQTAPLSPTPSPTPTATPTSSPTASPTPASGNLYITRLDIGLFSISVETLSNAGTVSGDTVTFAPNAPSQSFEPVHLYAFFVAQRVSN